MRRVGTKPIAAAVLAVVLALSLFVVLSSYLNTPSSASAIDVYVGVDAAFGEVSDMKAIIDQVKGYTNFFVVGSNNITDNLANINEVGQYLNDNGLAFMTYAHPEPDEPFSKADWARDAREKWGSSFIGFYAYDEPGGHQIDHDDFFMLALNVDSYAEAANTYLNNMSMYLDYIRVGWQTGDFPLITSDYALHGFDYRGGYDVILAELAWDNVRPLNIALVRGAATVHGKDWGIMITRSLNDTEHAESGQQMYNDMVLAYQNGAKYIVLFDYPNLADGILTQEHFDALQRFWNYAQNHPREPVQVQDRFAYVLPKDYGFGFRGPNDKLWGLWTDNQSAHIWRNLSSRGLVKG